MVASGEPSNTPAWRRGRGFLSYRRTAGSGDWATFNVMANAVLMGDHVSVSRCKDVAQRPRLKIDLATGMNLESMPMSLQAPAAQMRPQ